MFMESATSATPVEGDRQDIEEVEANDAAESVDSLPSAEAEKEESKIGAFVDELGDAATEALGDLLKEAGAELLGLLKERVFGKSDESPGQVEGGSETRPPVSEPAPAPSESGSVDFDTIVRDVLGPDADGSVDEEQLFAGVVLERLATLVGPEAGQAYRTAVGDEIKARTREDGYVPFEEAVVGALESLVARDVITSEQANEVYSQSFAAAQLDGDSNALFDGRGSPDDETVAVGEFESALDAARGHVAAFDSGEETAPARELGDSTNGVSSRGRGGAGAANDNSVDEGGRARGHRRAGRRREGVGRADGPDGFLFKPVSDTTGKLVILLPADWTGDVEGVRLLTQDGRVIEEGQYANVANGGREHFRFSRAGGDYPAEIVVEVQLEDGTTERYEIANPGERVD